MVWYTEMVETVAPRLTPANYERAVHIAHSYDRIRGYEEIKQKTMEQVRSTVQRLVETLTAEDRPVSTRAGKSTSKVDLPMID